MSKNTPDTESGSSAMLGLGIAAGIGIGVVIGLWMDNLFVGIVMGVGIGGAMAPMLAGATRSKGSDG